MAPIYLDGLDVFLTQRSAYGNVILMPSKRTMPGDEAAGPATLLASSGDPLHDGRPGPTAPSELSWLTRAVAWTRDDPRLHDGTALVVTRRVGDPRQPQPSRACPRSRDGVEARLSERDARLLGAVLDHLDPVGHPWMPAAPGIIAGAAKPRDRAASTSSSRTAVSTRRIDRRRGSPRPDRIDETGTDPSLKLAACSATATQMRPRDPSAGRQTC